MNHPLVSICMPVYNTLPYIEKAVKSVLSQNYPNFEVVILDDASTDGTWDFLQKLDHPLVRVFRNPTNVGAGENSNRTVSYSKGELITFLHGDDEMSADTLSYMVPWLLEVPSAVGTSIPFLIINADSQVTGEESRVLRPLLVKGIDILKGIPEVGNQLGGIGGKLIRKEDYLTVGGMPAGLRFYADWHLLCRLSTLGDWIFLPKAYYFYRHENICSMNYAYKHKDWKISLMAFMESWRAPEDTYNCRNRYQISKKDLWKWQRSLGGYQLLGALIITYRKKAPGMLWSVVQECRKNGVLGRAILDLFTNELAGALKHWAYSRLTNRTYQWRPAQIRKVTGTPLSKFDMTQNATK